MSGEEDKDLSGNFATRGFDGGVGGGGGGGGVIGPLDGSARCLLRRRLTRCISLVYCSFLLPLFFWHEGKQKMLCLIHVRRRVNLINSEKNCNGT